MSGFTQEKNHFLASIAKDHLYKVATVKRINKYVKKLHISYAKPTEKSSINSCVP